jgi:type I restriction enzyme S subunit
MNTEVREPSAKYLVSRGFKQTEIGPIPADWIVEPLGKRATFRTGPFGSALHKSDYVTDGTPIINPMHIVDGLIVPTIRMTVTDHAARMLSDFCVKPGEIIIGRRGDMGRCAVIREQSTGWICGTGSMIIRPERTNADFLQRVLSSPKVVGAIEDAAVGTTMVNLNQGTLANLKIQFPPRNEQDAIATALSDVDALIAGLEKLIAKKRDLKQAAMQQLLTGQTRLPGFSGEWTVKRLGDLAEMGSGGTPSSANGAYYGGDIPWVAIADMTGGGKYIADTERKLTTLGLANSPAQMFPAGTVLYAMYASLGECSVATIPVTTSQAILGIRPKPDLHSEFLYYLLTSWKSMVKGLGQQGTQANLNKGMVADFKISLPAFDEQKSIAAVLVEMDTELVALDSRLSKTRELKQGMMQELLTGRTRLISKSEI